MAEAIIDAGGTRIPARLIPLDRIVLGEYAENEIRKDFLNSERVAIGRAVERELGKRQGQRMDLGLRANLPEVEPGVRTREVAAQRAGFGSARTYEYAKRVVSAGAPELVGAMDRARHRKR